MKAGSERRKPAGPVCPVLAVEHSKHTSLQCKRTLEAFAASFHCPTKKPYPFLLVKSGFYHLGFLDRDPTHYLYPPIFFLHQESSSLPLSMESVYSGSLHLWQQTSHLLFLKLFYFFFFMFISNLTELFKIRNSWLFFLNNSEDFKWTNILKSVFFPHTHTKYTGTSF